MAPTIALTPSTPSATSPRCVSNQSCGLSDVERAPYDALREASREAAGETVIAAACEAGRAMTYEQGLDFALEHDTP